MLRLPSAHGLPLVLVALACHASGGPAVVASGGKHCPFPTSFQWTSTGPLAEPQAPSNLSLKDFTVAHANGKFVVYGTVFDTKTGWGGVQFQFDDWSQVASAKQMLHTYLRQPLRISLLKNALSTLSPVWSQVRCSFYIRT
jgi:hypothetical protein